MHRTTIMLPEPLRKRLAARARSMHVSIGELIRLAAVSFLDRQERQHAEDPLAGGGNYVIPTPSASDVSENVDRYLYGDPR